jgi:hypothetical protein
MGARDGKISREEGGKEKGKSGEGKKNWRKLRRYGAKVSVEDAKTTKKPKKLDTKGRRSRQKEVSEKTKRKVKARPRAETWEEKTLFWLGAFVFFCLAYKNKQLHQKTARQSRSTATCTCAFGCAVNLLAAAPLLSDELGTSCIGMRSKTQQCGQDRQCGKTQHSKRREIVTDHRGFLEIQGKASDLSLSGTPRYKVFHIYGASQMKPAKWSGFIPGWSCFVWAWSSFVWAPIWSRFVWASQTTMGATKNDGRGVSAPYGSARRILCKRRGGRLLPASSIAGERRLSEYFFANSPPSIQRARSS